MLRYTPIHLWNEDDRPREKLLNKGRYALSDSELIAILIGTGTRNESAVELAKKILNLSQNNLNQLGKLSIREFMKIKGIGEAKAINIAAALELGRRRKNMDPIQMPAIKSSEDAFQELSPVLSDLNHEEFWILLLNRANKVIALKLVSSGGLTGTVADPRNIFKMALENEACGIILAHNHPSGNKQPSQSDIDLTKKLKEAGKFIDIQILDHLIIANNIYFSFADEGML